MPRRTEIRDIFNPVTGGWSTERIEVDEPDELVELEQGLSDLQGFPNATEIHSMWKARIEARAEVVPWGSPVLSLTVCGHLWWAAHVGGTCQASHVRLLLELLPVGSPAHTSVQTALTAADWVAAAAGEP